ncbi:MAG: DUF485 domain-containing protein [Myxococcaceae bacterium]
MTPELSVPAVAATTPSNESTNAVRAVAAMRWRMAIVLSLLMLVTYFAFVLGIAFDKPSLGTLITQGLSVGIVLGAGVILTAFGLTAFYAWWANRVYDPALDQVARGGK